MDIRGILRYFFQLKEIVLASILFLIVATPYLENDPFNSDEIIPASLATNTIVGDPNRRHTNFYLDLLERSFPVNRVCDILNQAILSNGI